MRAGQASREAQVILLMRAIFDVSAWLGLKATFFRIGVLARLKPCPLLRSLSN